MKKFISKRILFTISLLILLAGTIYALFEKLYDREMKRVLVVQSYDKNYPSNHLWDEEIQKAFTSKDSPVEIKTIYLDCERYNDDEELEHMNELLREIEKQNWEPDVILVNDDQGCFSYLKCGHKWTDQKPMVFGGVNYPNWKLLASHENVTGFHDSIDLENNLKLIDAFQRKKSPDYYVMVFLDSTYLERKIRKDMTQFFEKHSDKFDYIDKNTLIGDSEADFELAKVYSQGFQNFVEQIKESKDKITVFSTRVRSGSGANLMWNCSTHEDMADYYLKLTANISTETAEAFCQMPKFTAINERFGAGRHYVAGYLTTMAIQADEMADAAVKIFDGAKPKDLPIAKSRKEYVADWEALKFFHIDPEEFDGKFHIINMPFYVKYMWYLIALAILFIIWNIHTLVYLRKNQKLERKLKEVAQAELADKNKKLVDSLKQLKDQYHELQEVRKMVEKAELKQSFIDSMSHEIRTPLNAIVGFSNLLVDEQTAHVLSDEEKREFMNLIQKNTELLLKLVNDILEISRIESGDIPIHLEPCSTQYLFQKIHDEHLILIQDKKFLIENDGVESNISVDPIRYEQVITNLLNNANKFTENGTITLGCRYNETDRTMTMYVRDTGIGIAEDEQKMIFRRFYKIDPFTQGTGLGLSICMAIADKMHGTIEVESELGKGSCFSVTIPAVKK